MNSLFGDGISNLRVFQIYGGKLRRFVHHHFGQQCGFLISPPQDISGSSRTPDIGSNYLLRFQSVSVSLSRQLLHMSIQEHAFLELVSFVHILQSCQQQEIEKSGKVSSMTILVSLSNFITAKGTQTMEEQHYVHHQRGRNYLFKGKKGFLFSCTGCMFPLLGSLKVQSLWYLLSISRPNHVLLLFFFQPNQ